MSLGLGEPMPQDARVQAAIEETIRAAHNAGVFVSLSVGTTQANIEKYVELGVDMLELGNDLGIMRSAWKTPCRQRSLQPDICAPAAVAD